MTAPRKLEVRHLDAARGPTVRPGHFHLARAEAAEVVTHPLLDEVEHARSATADIQQGRYLEVSPSQVMVYRISAGGRTQLGLLLEAAVVDYVDGRIRPHEATRPHAVTALADHLERIGVDVAPVTLAHPSDPAIDRILAAIAASTPTLDTTSEDGTEHHVWLVDAHQVADAVDRLNRVAALYVVDGHHRFAAGALLAERSRRTPPGEAGADHVFAFVVGDDQLALASYHLLVQDVTAPPEDVAAAVGAHLDAEATPVDAGEVGRIEPGTIAMWSAGRWYRYDVGRSGPLGDAAMVHEEVLGPVFGITEPEEDRRLDHVAGTLDPRDLPARCARDTVAFVVHPPSVAALLGAADAGRSVPAKSSFFHPKVPAGLFVRRRR